MIDPKEFELSVKTFLEEAGGELTDFDTKHREMLEKGSQVYEIDVSVRFQALRGAEFLVLVECKAWRKRVDRSVVEILCERTRAIGASKGMVFSLSGFQRGAIDYAKECGVALVELVDSDAIYVSRGTEEGAQARHFVGYWPQKSNGIRMGLARAANVAHCLDYLMS